MKDETGGVGIKEFVRLKPKMYSFLVDNSEHKKAKEVDSNAVATISHNNNSWLSELITKNSYFNNYLKKLFLSSILL